MELIQEIYEKLKECPYIYKICVEKEIIGNACYNNVLKLDFCNLSHNYNENKISIIFQDVQNLEIKNFDGLMCVYIDIIDLSDRQLENINYYIKESEEDMFSFYCSSIELQ